MLRLVPHIGLAKKFIRILLLHHMKKSEQTFWPAQCITNGTEILAMSFFLNLVQGRTLVKLVDLE